MKKVNWLLRFNIITFLFPFIIGCLSLHGFNQLPPEFVIVPPHSDFAKDIYSRTWRDLQEIVNEVQATYDLSALKFIKEGIFILYTGEDKKEAYFAFTLNHCVTYNTLQTNYQKRAATTYMKNLFALSKIISSHPKLFMEEKIIGFYVDLRWAAKDFLRDQYQSGVMEDMRSYIPKEILKDFADMKISIQELSRQSSLTSSMGKVELDFSNTL